MSPLHPISPYHPQDQEEVLGLIRLNTPTFFAEAEEADLRQYLVEERDQYYVMRLGQELIGCGGYNRVKPMAYISWDIFHPAHQGRGYGKQLLTFRLQKLQEDPDIQQIVVRTSQFTYQFYEKGGFQLVNQQADYWAPGIDLCYMVYQSEGDLRDR